MSPIQEDIEKKIIAIEFKLNLHTSIIIKKLRETKNIQAAVISPEASKLIKEIQELGAEIYLFSDD